MASTEFSTKEQAVIDELKKRTTDCVSPKMLEDNYLFYRFAKARGFNLANAESMLRKNVEWRKKMGTDTVTTEYKPPEVLAKYIPSCLLCFDKEGCAVRYTDTGRTDDKGLWNCERKQAILKYFLYLVEQDKEVLMKRDKKLQKQLFMPIFNFEKLTYAFATNMTTLQYLAYFTKSYTDNYPETLKYILVINAPFYFIWLFRIFKQVLPADVIEKIRIYGTDGWKEDLLKMIDADVLPAFLGGNRTDPDGNPQCNTIVKWGIPIPKSYYMTKEKKKINSAFEKLTILPFSKKEIDFGVKEANSDLEWEFDVKSKDINFSLHFKGTSLEIEELVPQQRIDTCYELEKGFFKCEKVGIYTLVLDNTYSWIYSKEVYLRVVIKPPTHKKSDQLL